MVPFRTGNLVPWKKFRKIFSLTWIILVKWYGVRFNLVMKEFAPQVLNFVTRRRLHFVTAWQETLTIMMLGNTFAGLKVMELLIKVF